MCGRILTEIIHENSRETKESLKYRRVEIIALKHIIGKCNKNKNLFIQIWD